MAEVFTRTMYSTTFRLSEDGTKIRKFAFQENKFLLKMIGENTFVPPLHRSDSSNKQ